MHKNLKRLCIFMIVIMFFAVISGGCGGGGSSDSSPQGNENSNNNNNNGWDTDPDERNQNNNNNDNQNNNNNDNNQNDNNNGNNGENNNNNGDDNNNNNNNNGSPVAINGTWEIVSGHAVVSHNGRTSSLTYKQGSTGEVGIEMVSTQSLYGNIEMYRGLYTLKLTGENVMGQNGLGSLFVSYSYDDYPDRTNPLTFSSFPSFKYIGSGTYEMTEENLMNSGVSTRFTVTLENSSTLHLYYETEADTSHLGFDINTTGWWDIYLRKVK